jgi:hypothetical protein
METKNKKKHRKGQKQRDDQETSGITRIDKRTSADKTQKSKQLKELSLTLHFRIINTAYRCVVTGKMLEANYKNCPVPQSKPLHCALL